MNTQEEIRLGCLRSLPPPLYVPSVRLHRHPTSSLMERIPITGGELTQRRIKGRETYCVMSQSSPEGGEICASDDELKPSDISEWTFLPFRRKYPLLLGAWCLMDFIIFSFSPAELIVVVCNRLTIEAT